MVDHSQAYRPWHYSRLLHCAFILVIAASLHADEVPGSVAEPSSYALVETTTLTAIRESVRVYTQVIGVGDGQPTAAPVVLPGTAFDAHAVLDDSRKRIAITSRAQPFLGSNAGETFICMLTVPSNVLASDGWTISDPGWREIAACITTSSVTSESSLVTLVTPLDETKAGEGRITARNVSADGPLSLAAKPASWLLPGVPADAVSLPETSRVAVLCKNNRYGTVLHVRDIERGEVVVERKSLFEDSPGLTPLTVACNRRGTFLLALATGPGSDVQSARDASWLRAISVDALEAVGDPLEVRGVPREDSSPIHAASDGTFWIATREPQSGFAFVTQVSLDRNSGLAKVAEYSFSGVAQALRVAPAARGADVALGVNDRVEVWRDGKPGGNAHPFETSVNAVAWLGDRILVGEANRIHQIQPGNEAADDVVASFQTGIVSRIIPVGGSASRATMPGENDGDRATNPGLKSKPRLSPPRVMRFRGEAAGRELHAIQIKVPFAEPGLWRLDWNQTQVPWLNAYPQTGTVPGWFLMGVDRRQYEPGTTQTGWLNLRAESVAGRTPYAGSPYRIAVRVAPSRPAIRRILWALPHDGESARLRSAQDPFNLKAVVDLLAAAPFHFSHDLALSPILQSLSAYSVVVLDCNAIASGMVTRQAVLDYVSSGGALLYLAEPLEETDLAMAARWLLPMGITIDSVASTSGTFEPIVQTPLTRHCPAWFADGAAGITLDNSWQILVANTDRGDAGLAIRTFGSGRTAAITSRTPLESAKLADTENRRFVSALFQWLGNAGEGVQDLDADGLPDNVEDKNGDGVVGPGETDRMNPDTDGDGVPDGDEDRNHNGAVNDGETDPLNPDTDSDGTFDGADLTPLPAREAPRVVSIDPRQGPAEGGAVVTITGANFTPDAHVWFGEIPSPHVRFLDPNTLVAESPPNALDAEGAVDLRAEFPAAGVSVTVPKGFVYGPRSTVRLVLEATAASDVQYEGTFRLALVSDTNVAVGRIVVRIDTEPPGELDWSDLRPGADALIAGRRVLQRETTSWGITFEITAPNRRPYDGELATLRWRTRQPIGFDPQTPIVLRTADAYALNGEPLAVETHPTTITWTNTPATIDP